LQVDGLLEAFCEDAKITVDEAIQGIGRLNKITDLHDMFSVSRTSLKRTSCDLICILVQFIMFTNLLSTYADRQGVDISVTVCVFVFCVCVFMVTDFSSDDEASDVVFCTAVQQHPRLGISHFGELC